MPEALCALHQLEQMLLLHVNREIRAPGIVQNALCEAHI